ncbi:3-oxoacyl-ACP reductase FabG [Candidatus Riflebacteria bacterium]
MENVICDLVQDKIVIISGGARGIGLELVKAFARRNTVHFFDISQSSLEKARFELEEELPDRKGNIFPHVCPVDSFESVNSFVQKVLEESKKIDVVINNAGITRDRLLLRMSEEDWDQVLRVNLKGCFNLCKATVKLLVKNRKGVVINIGSFSGLRGNFGQCNYSASKAGIHGLTKALAKELASRNIRVNAIAPGFVETDMTKELFKDEEKAKEFLKTIPLARMGQTEDITSMALFLASDCSSYITGQVFSVDGGMSI